MRPSGSFTVVSDAMGAPASERRNGMLPARLLSAVVMGPLALLAVYFGPPVFDAMVAAAALVLAFEWYRLCATDTGGMGRLQRTLWLVAGFPYIVLPSAALVWLRADPTLGRETVFWLFALVWAADTGAYVCGRLIGGPRLAPRISPAKTWAGLLGAIVSAAIAGAVTATIIGYDGALPLAAVSAALGAVAQAGDLAESWVKRQFRVKDTGTLIPGHGGLMDRVDGSWRRPW